MSPDPVTSITSKQNQRVKDAAGLRDRRGRERAGRIIIDGVREIDRALVAGVEIEQLFACEALLRPGAEGLATRAAAAGAEVIAVSAAVFAKLSFGDRREGVVAVARPPRVRLVDLSAVPGGSLLAVVEGVEKGGNLGAVVRSADAAGLAAVIVADGRTDIYNPNAIRASAGTIFAVPVADASSAEALAWLRERDYRILAARVDGAVGYTHADYSGATALVVGRETSGLSAVWRGDGVTSIALPMRGAADSLNVSVTAAVLFFEALRQREEPASHP